MQNAKDSFYMALRTRLATINPERTVLLRGALRPGFWSKRPKRPSAQLPSDVFVLALAGPRRRYRSGFDDGRRGMRDPLQHLRHAGFGGLDRGRMLSEMDEEVIAMLQPFYTPKLNYTVQPPAAMVTQVFWDEPAFAPHHRAARPAQPFRKSHGLQLSGAGGVDDGHFIFSSGAGRASCARLLCAGEPRHADSCRSSILLRACRSISMRLPLPGSILAGFRISRANPPVKAPQSSPAFRRLRWSRRGRPLPHNSALNF